LAKRFAKKNININIHTHICVKFRPKKHISLILPVQPKKIVRTKKGGKKVKAWQVETPKRWPASGGLTQPFLERKIHAVYILAKCSEFAKTYFKMAK